MIRCSMKTAGLGFDSFGIPLPEQTVTLIYTKNGEEVRNNTGVRITTGPRARGPKNGGGAPRFSG